MNIFYFNSNLNNKNKDTSIFMEYIEIFIKEFQATKIFTKERKKEVKP